MKLSITIDVSKINKNKITERKFTNSQGEEITVKEYRMDILPLKEEKTIKTGDGWEMVKSHFVVESPSKEEKDQKIKTPFLGDGIEFRLTQPVEQVVDNTEDINPDDVPF